MEKFRIAAVQMNALKGDLNHNLDLHRRFSREAVEAGCRLIQFPELSTTAHYGDDSVTEFAEEAHRGGIFETMHGLARELDLVISYGLCERAHGTFYNSQVLVGPDGFIGVQRKIHASHDEYFHFRMGRSLEVFHLGFCRVGTLICYDGNFFEGWRVLALKGAEVVLLPHASRCALGKKRSDRKVLADLKRMLKGLPSRTGFYAQDNAVFAVFGNQIGYNGHSTHSGGAYILSPKPEVLAKAEPVMEDLWISTELDPTALDASRGRSTLRNRRPEVYDEIARMI